MYIKDDQHKELDTRDYSHPFVEPRYGLYIRDRAGSEHLIASFKTMREAHAARNSLKEAIENGEDWDVHSFASNSTDSP